MRKGQRADSHTPNLDGWVGFGLRLVEDFLIPRFVRGSVEDNQMPLIGVATIHILTGLLEALSDGAL